MVSTKMLYKQRKEEKTSLWGTPKLRSQREKEGLAAEDTEKEPS